MTPWWRRIVAVLRRPQLDARLEEEISAHAGMLASEYESRGLSPGEARARARRDLGNATSIVEEHRDARGLPGLDALLQDLAYGLRTLRKDRAFTAAAIIVLALGAGANAAIYTLARATLFRPFPFPRADRLLTVWERDTIRGIAERNPSPAAYRDWLAEPGPFKQLAAYFNAAPTLTGDGEPERLAGQFVTTNFFETLGMRPQAGRWIEAGDARVAMVSHSFWQRMGGRADVVGRKLTLDGETHTVIGVMPDGMRALSAADVWIPITFGAEEWKLRDNFITVIGRLKDSVTLGSARSRMSAISAHLRAQPAYTGIDITLTPMTAHAVRTSRTTMLALLTTVVLLLAASCASVANLVLARTAAREAEIRVRRAIGASPGRIARQLITEGILLTALGTLAGLLLAAALKPALARLLPADLASPADLRLDLEVILAIAAAGAISGALLSAAPALQALHGEDGQLRAHGRNVIGGLRAALTSVQVALGLTTLIVAAFLGQTLLRLTQVDLGLRPGGILTMRLDLSPARFSNPAERARFHDALTMRLRALPGVEAAAMVTFLPLTDPGRVGFSVEGRPEMADQARLPFGRLWVVTPDYFRAMGINIVSGRTFDDRDRGQSSTPVVVVNRQLAERFWPNGDATRGRIKRGPSSGEGTWSQVIGVVGDVRGTGLDQPFEPEIYMVDRQYRGFFVPRDLVVRVGNADSAALAPAIKREVWSVDSSVPISRVRSFGDVVDANLVPSRFRALLVGSFALAAVALAAAGIYGVVAFSVARRSREIGLRIALGAQRASLVRQFVAQSLRVALPGLAVGTAAAFILLMLLQKLLFGVRPGNAAIYAICAAFLAVLVVIAALIPARRAAAVNPARVLRLD